MQKIIDLNKDLLNSQNVASSSTSAAGASISKQNQSQPDNVETKHNFAAGDECQAKYEGDGRYYDARIVSVAGSQHNPMYTILFKGYNETAIVTSESLKPSKHAHHRGTTAAESYSTTATSRQTKLTPEEEAERERKKKR